MSSQMPFVQLKPETKSRLAVTCYYLPKHKHNVIDMELACKNFGKDIQADSFKTEFGRKISKPWNSLSNDTKDRFAACFYSIKSGDLKDAMAKVDWKQAARDFHPGKDIKPESFKTAIGRVMSSGIAGGKANKKTKAVAQHGNDDSNDEASTVPQVPKKKAPVSKKRSRAVSASPADDDDDENVASMSTAPPKKKTALAPKKKKRATAATSVQDPSEAEEASGHTSTPHSPKVKVEDTDLDYANGEDDDGFGALMF